MHIADTLSAIECDRSPSLLRVGVHHRDGVMDVGHEAKTQMGVGVIEDQAIFLGFGGSQSSTDHLHEKNLGLGWSREDNAAHVPIDARRQASDVADDSNIPVVKPPFDLPPLADRCARVNVTR